MAARNFTPANIGRGGGTAMVQAHGGRIGNPPHEWSERTAAKVQLLSALGNSIEAIAFAVDLHPQTISKHYRSEVDRGLSDANHRVGGAVLQSAVGEQVPCADCEDTPGKAGGKMCKTCHGTSFVWRREPNTTAQIWWSKNRMGWTDRERIEHVGDGGGPIIHEQRNSGDAIKQRLLAIRARTANDGAK